MATSSLICVSRSFGSLRRVGTIAVLGLSAGLLCFGCVAQVGTEAGSLARPPASQPEQVTLRIDDATVITTGFLGFGVELDPMALNANNRKRGVTDKDWKLITERLADMHMPIVRMMTHLGWFAKEAPDKFDYESPQAKAVLAYLAFCQTNNIDVILTDWAAMWDCKWIAGYDDPAFGKGVATYLKYLLENRKFTCIKYLVIGNEPDREIKDIEKYSRMYHNVDAALKAAGIRGKVKLMGPDTTQGHWDWFDQASAKISDVVDAYDFHRYAEEKEVRKDGQQLLLHNLGRFQPVVDKIDAKGPGKPVLLTEMGMAGGKMYAHKLIDTSEYALHMGDYAIGVLNSGVSAGIAWSAFDVYYGDGDNLMATGMWKYRDKQWEPRPWYEVWKAVTENMRYGKDVLAVAGATADVHAAVVGHAIAEDESGRKARSGYSVLLSNRSDTDTLLSVPLDGHGWRGWRADVGVITAVGKPSQMVINENYEENEKYVRVTLPARSFCTIEIKFATQPAKVARRVATRDKIKAINTIIAKLDDGTLVRFLDSGERFLQGDGTLSKDIMPDYVHLSAKGYQIWAESMQPLLAEMLSLPATQPERP